MNRFQRKLYKLSKVMYLSSISNCPDFNMSFKKYYRRQRWVYKNEAEIDEVLVWFRRGIKNG